MRNCIYAGIVSYNPDIGCLKKNIEAICGQVPLVAIVDNGSANIEEIRKYVSEIENVELVCFETNKGIAAALNRLMQYGNEKGYEWMLSLDQDSVCPPDYCKKAQFFLYNLPKTGIVAPIIHDRKVGIVGHNPTGEYGIVNTCITSGAFVRVDVWRHVGGYDEKMFIDSVDFEFCYRVRKAGYKVIQSGKLVLEHSIGEGKIVAIGPFRKKIKEHSAFRCFYIAQNNVYYPKKHGLVLRFIRGNFRNVGHMITVLFFESDKKQKIRAIWNGWKSGLCIKVENR